MGNITRRAFIRGSTICLTTLGGLRLGLGMKKARASWIGNRFVVYVFLRGGMDGLNLVAPISGPDRDPYVTKRPTIYLRTTGETAALPVREMMTSRKAASSSTFRLARNPGLARSITSISRNEPSS